MKPTLSLNKLIDWRVVFWNQQGYKEPALEWHIPWKFPDDTWLQRRRRILNAQVLSAKAQSRVGR